MNNKVIIFDLDGVLFDSTAIVTKYLLSVYPDLTEEIQKEILVGNFHEEMAKLEAKKIPETEEQKAERKRKYSAEKASVKMFPGAHELLVSLHDRGYMIVLNTSAFTRNCMPMIENSGVADLFDFMATADVSMSKVEKFKIISEKYGVDSTDMIFITDTLGDIREADTAGVPTVAVTWGVHDRIFFSRETHQNIIKIVDSFEELDNFIKSTIIV